MQSRLKNKIALITGGSRGIGAVVTRLLADRGADVAINFRSKAARAEEIASQVRALGKRALLAQGDLTDEDHVNRMMEKIHKSFGKLDILVLNASGGLEKDRPASYAMDLNRTAQLNTLIGALQLMPKGGCIVFVTSHWAHFYGQRPVYKGYESIAASKRAGEDALRAELPNLTARGLRLAIVSGDMIDGTITPKLLERSQPGLIAERRSEVGVLPTVEEFAAAIVDAAEDSSRPSGHVTFIGPT